MLQQPMQLHPLLVQILAFSPEMGKGLINSSVVHCMTPLETSQRGEVVQHISKTAGQTFFKFAFSIIFKEAWTSALLMDEIQESFPDILYLTININCILPVSSSDNPRQSALHIPGKYPELQKCQQAIHGRFLCSLLKC